MAGVGRAELYALGHHVLDEASQVLGFIELLISVSPLPLLSFPPSPNQLVRKLDIRLLPCCFFLYFFSALDRGNLGNAKSAGLEKDLGFKANEYGILLTCFTLSFSLLVRPVLFFLCSLLLMLELT